MAKKKKKFADDGWAIYINGNNDSTIYLNEWLNPHGKSFVDVGLRIRGIKECHKIYLFIPFRIVKEDVNDVSLLLNDMGIFRAIFSTICLMDYKKNRCVSETAYNRKTVDLVHISETGFELENVDKGTLLTVDLDSIQQYLDNEEAYFLFRIPYKSLDEVFNTGADMRNILERLRDLITSPVITEKYGYSVRVNEARLLPEEISRNPVFIRQKLHKSVVSISVLDEYEVVYGNCYRTSRLEDQLYKNYLPEGFEATDAITYQWKFKNDSDSRSRFNYYFDISRQTISKTSMFVYLIILLCTGVAGDATWDMISRLIGLE